MRLSAYAFRAGVLCIVVAAAACSGATQRVSPADTTPETATGRLAPLSAGAAPAASASTSPSPSGYGERLAFTVVSGDASRLQTALGAPPPGSCPAIPLIRLENTSASPITIVLRQITVTLPCDVSGRQFADSFFQLRPQPAVLQATKFGDDLGHGQHVTFTRTERVTVPPGSVSAIAVVLDPSGAGLGLPVAPGSTTVLTPGGGPIPTSLSINYGSAQGGSLYSSACFDASLLPPSVPRVGRPSFFCRLDPGDAPITLDTHVVFGIGAPLPDASVLGLDGTLHSFSCAGVSPSSCDTTKFTMAASTAAVQNVIVGNVDDLRACVPATRGVDCNGTATPPPSFGAAVPGAAFQLLVADDATYRPGAGPWDGVFRAAVVSGPCAFYDPHDPADTPAGYAEGPIGPRAELDVKGTGSGTCVLSVSEDPRFIIADFSNPAAPKGRSVQVSFSIP